MKLFPPHVIAWSARKGLNSRFVERSGRKRDSEICDAIRSYLKRKASKKKKRKDLAVLAKTPRLNRFF